MSNTASTITKLMGDNNGVMHSGSGNIDLNFDAKAIFSLLLENIPGLNKIAELRTEVPLDNIVGMPLPPIKFCKREISIEKQMEFLDIYTWLNYFGDVWSGKTYFVSLLVNRYAPNTNWFCLKGLNDTQINYVMKMILKNMEDISEDVKSNKINFEGCSIIVLDDIPVFNRTSIFFERLIALVNACKVNNLKLITTTQRCVQSQVQSFIQAEDFESVKIPEFTEVDIEQMLSLFNANSDFINEKFISFLKIQTKGNPALANAVCSYMSVKNWLTSSSGIIGIINGEYYWQLNNEVQDILISTTNDDDCRELLYRISEIGWSVTAEDVSSICSIEPLIKFPMEKLNTLLGSWISLDKDEKYLSSPLISKISKNNISNDTRKGIHEIIANNILAKKVIDPFEALRAITHFINAENYIGAGLTYINLLNKMNEADIHEDYWYVSFIWYNTQLPELMPIDIKIPLRAIQINYCYKANKDINYLLNDFDSLLQTCPDHLQSFAFYVGISIYKTYPQKANKYMINSLNELPKIADFISQESEINDKYRVKKIIDNLKPETAFLITSTQIKTPNDLIDWIEIVKELSEEQLKNLFDDDLFPDLYMILPSKVWLYERTKSEELREWNKVLDCIEHLITFARDNDLELLWACSIRAKIIILTEEFDDNFDLGIQTGIEAIQQASDDPEVQYVLNDIIAKEYTHKKEYDKAIVMFKKILNQETSPFSVEKVMTFLRYSEAIEKEDTDESVKYSYRALKLAENLEGVKGYFYVQILVEYIICLWNCGKQAETPFYLEEAVEKILDCKQNDKEWKKVFMITGHILGYYVPLLTGRSAPEKLSDGEEEYTVPYRMFSVKDKPDALADLFDEEKLFVLPLNMFTLYKHLNNKEKSIKWAKITFSFAKTSSHKDLLFVGYYDLGYYLLVGREYEASFRIILYINFISTILQYKRNLDIKSDTEFYFNNEPNEIKEIVEINSLILWGVPAFIAICNKASISENEAINEAELVINTINSFKNIFINKAICDEIIEVITSIIEKRASYHGLIRQGNINSRRNNYLMETMTYLAAILYATPEQAMDIKSLIISFIDRYFGTSNIIYGNIIGFLSKGPI